MIYVLPVPLQTNCKVPFHSRYKILQETHDSEQNKAHEMSDALRNSVRILKSYIDRYTCDSYISYLSFPINRLLEDQFTLSITMSSKLNFVLLQWYLQKRGCQGGENERTSRPTRNTEVI